MGTRLGALVERFGGQLHGDANLEVTGIAPLSDAGASDISFLSNSKLRAQAAGSGACALIVSPQDDEAVAAGFTGARIVTNNPYVYFARAAQYFAALTAFVPAPGIDPSASVSPEAQVDPSAHIGPQVTVEGRRGDRPRRRHRCRLLHRPRSGDRRGDPPVRQRHLFMPAARSANGASSIRARSSAATASDSPTRAASTSRSRKRAGW